MVSRNHTPLSHHIPRTAETNVLHFPVIPGMGIQHEGQNRRRKVLELLDRLRELCANNSSHDDSEATLFEAVYRIASVTKKWIVGEIGGAR